MSTIFAIDPTFEHVEALLDRFDPPRPVTCDVPGCTHRFAGHHDATWVADPLAA